jgi:hypothetical protein
VSSSTLKLLQPRCGYLMSRILSHLTRVDWKALQPRCNARRVCCHVAAELSDHLINSIKLHTNSWNASLLKRTVSTNSLAPIQERRREDRDADLRWRRARPTPAEFMVMRDHIVITSRLIEAPSGKVNFLLPDCSAKLKMGSSIRWLSTDMTLGSGVTPDGSPPCV